MGEQDRFSRERHQVRRRDREPSGRIDVTSEASRRLIIPTFQEVLDLHPLKHAVITSERRERYKEIASTVRERIVKPVFGTSLTPYTFFPNELPLLDEGFEVDLEEFDSSGYLPVHKNVVLDQRFVTGKIPTLATPNIRNTVAIAYGSLFTSGRTSNPPEFRTNAHVETMQTLIRGMDHGNMTTVMDSLRLIDSKFSDEDEKRMHGRLRDAENMSYRIFGDLASAARFVDKFYFTEFRKSSSFVVADNFVGYGDDVLVNAYGGIISNAILAVGSRKFLDFSHIRLKNVYVITREKEEYYGSHTVGNPKAAEAVVTYADSRGENPLAQFAQRFS